MTSPQTLPVVIGTAGHIDHGKSALVEALCHQHPDRWQEEKERGITLDLGYAEAHWEDGLEVGFVDVPGHEKLVRKMVAGATGMGAAILVIACDDGVMPQTREHFEVLQLLGLNFGLVALSKADLADQETREFVREDVADLLRGTSWEGVQILTMSVHSGEGMVELKTAIRDLAKRAQASASPLYAFRLPVQRAFALHGAGTVVTGVCASGQLEEGQDVEAQPSGLKSRVRRVHIHGRQSSQALPGLRTALNLPQLDLEHCKRGVVMAAPGTLRAGSLLHLDWQPLAKAPNLKQGGEVQVLSGTAAVEGRLYLPLTESAEGELVADVLLQEDMALVPGDRVILRRPSPATNLGVGRFLAFGKHRLRTKDQDRRGQLIERAHCLDSPADLLLGYLNSELKPMGAGDLSLEFGWTAALASQLLQEAALAGKVRELSPGSYVGMGRAGALAQEIAEVVNHWKSKNPHRICIPLQNLRARLGKEKLATLQTMSRVELALLGLVPRPGLLWEMHGLEVAPEWSAWAETSLLRLGSEGLMPTNWLDLAKEVGVPVDKSEELGEYLEDIGKVLRRGPHLFDRAVVESLRELVVAQLQGEGMNIPALRDHFQTSRKYLMPLLEFLDDRGVTMRRGGNRILRNPEASLV